MKDKKQMIMDFLKTINFASTTKIADKIRSNTNDTDNYLMELLEDGKVGLTNSPDERIRWWYIPRYKKLPLESDRFVLKKIKKEVKK